MVSNAISSSCFWLSHNARAAIGAATGYKKTELHLLDLAKFASVVDFAEKFKNEPLDILIANAGVAMGAYETTPDGWETTLVTLSEC